MLKAMNAPHRSAERSRRPSSRRPSSRRPTGNGYQLQPGSASHKTSCCCCRRTMAMSSSARSRFKSFWADTTSECWSVSRRRDRRGLARDRPAALGRLQGFDGVHVNQRAKHHTVDLRVGDDNSRLGDDDRFRVPYLMDFAVGKPQRKRFKRPPVNPLQDRFHVHTNQSTTRANERQTTHHRRNTKKSTKRPAKGPATRPPSMPEKQAEPSADQGADSLAMLAAALADLSAGRRRRIGSSLHSTRISASWHFAEGFRRLAAWPCSESARKIRNTF